MFNAPFRSLLAMIGVVSDRLPNDGTPRFLVLSDWLPFYYRRNYVTDNAFITIWVEPFTPRQPGQRKRSKHRVKAHCGRCQREFSAGRLHQHVCTKPESN